MVLLSIISSLARDVIGKTSVGLNAVVVVKAPGFTEFLQHLREDRVMVPEDLHQQTYQQSTDYTDK